MDGSHPSLGRGLERLFAERQTCEALPLAGIVIDVAQDGGIFAQGGNTETFYRIVSGVVRICRFFRDGRRQIEAFHGAGELFGFELNHERSMSAEAVTACALICYRRSSAEMLAQKDRSVSQQLFHYAMQCLGEAQDHALLLGGHGAAGKVAAFLLDWARRGNACGKVEIVELAMTRQDIADYLGMALETVSRSLSQFERDGVIASKGSRKIRILSPKVLENLAADNFS